MASSTEIRVSKSEMIEPLERLFKAMPQQRGIALADRMDGYFTALRGFSLADIDAGIDRYLAGKVAGISKKFCPSPPELAEIVAGTADLRAVPKAPAERACQPPRSVIIHRGITKAQVRQYREQGAVEAGVIWMPGTDNPAFGDLYAPDPDWKPPRS